MKNLEKALNTELAKIELNNMNHTYSAIRWEKYGKKRIYINRTNGRNQKTVGFIENRKLIDKGLSYDAKEIIESELE